MVIDVHTHFIPPELIEMIGSGSAPGGLEVEHREGRDPLIVHDNGLRYPAFEIFRDVDARVANMNELGVDVSIVSISPSLYLYWLDPSETVEVCRVLNDAAAHMAGDAGGRVYAMATVPMNEPAAAAEELRRAHQELGLVGVEIGTSVGTRQLDEAVFDDFFGVAAELGTPVMLHPYLSMITPPGPALEGYHLGNVIGNPVETFSAACRLLVGGVFDRHPDLRVLLVHGGGALPYQIGRLQHAYGAREESAASAARPPLDYLDNLRFDTVIFDPRALEFLIGLAGAERVLFGTDLPFDMGDVASRDLLTAGDPAIAEQVLGGNAAQLFGIEAPTASAVQGQTAAS